MKWMFKFVFLAATLWSGYWYFGAQAQEKLFADLLTESRDQGWVAESSALSVSGFPNRFDTTLTELDFQDPTRRWGWRAEAFQVKALSYQPNHIIMAWPGAQRIRTPEGSATLAGKRLRASLVVSPTNTLPLARLQIEGEDIAITDAPFGSAQIGGLHGALFQNETAPTRYHFGLSLANITPPTSFAGLARGLIEKVELSAQLDFGRELDRFALQTGQPPRMTAIDIERGTLIWGDSKLVITGALAAGAAGYIEGSLSFEAENWQPLFETFKRASAMSATELLTLKRALDAASGGGDLTFTVNFTDGKSRIGPFTIGPAPRIPY